MWQSSVYTTTDHHLPVDDVDLAPIPAPLCVAMVVEGATIEGGPAHDPTLHQGGGTDAHEGDQGMDICSTEGGTIVFVAERGRGGGDHRPLSTQRGMRFW